MLVRIMSFKQDLMLSIELEEMINGEIFFIITLRKLKIKKL